MDQQSVVLRVTSSTGFAVAGVIADVAAVVALAVQQDVRNWVSQNPVVMLAVTAASALLALFTFNAYSRARQRALAIAGERTTELNDLRQRVFELEATLREPSAADIARWREFSTDFGRDSILYIWLREHFYTSYAYEYEVNELDRLCQKWQRDAAKYYDSDVEDAFSSLRSALFELREATINNYYYENNAHEIEIGKRRLHFPPEWNHKRKHDAITEVSNACDGVIKQYDAFMSVAQRKKLVGSEL